MSDNNIQFDSDQQQFQSRPDAKQKGGLIGLLVRNGLAKDEAGANKVLIAILIIVIILIIIVNQ
jgi:hypothetical protein